MILVNFKARQDPPPTQCPLFFPQSHVYFQAKRRLQTASLLDLPMQVKQKSSCMTQSNFFADQQLTSEKYKQKINNDHKAPSGGWGGGGGAHQVSIRGLAKSID